MNIRLPLLAVAGAVIFCSTAAQTLLPGQFSIRETLMESLSTWESRPADYETILNDLEYLQQKPVDLNKASKEDLQRIPFLTEFQIQSILNYRKEYGNLLSLNELSLVYGFTDDLVRVVLPYVTITTHADSLNLRFMDAEHVIRNEVQIRMQRVLEKAAGFRETDPVTGEKRYPGNPWLYNLRYGLQLNGHLQAGLNLEKDPGEEFFKDSNRQGFDFISAYARVSDLGYLKSAIVGDYRLAFGQGLTLCHGTAPGKSALSLNIIKRTDDVKAFTSADENVFFRGVAARLAWGRVNLTGFFSLKKRDANITDTLPDGRILFSSFQESGYHRTLAENIDEKSLTEKALGMNMTYRGDFYKLGLTLVQYRLDKYMDTGDDMQDIRDFQGNDLLNWGIDYSVTWKKLQLFGETSFGNHDWATLNGALLNINKFASFSLLYRNYGTGYFSLHSDAFSEGSSNANEEAVYAGMVINPARKLKMSAYADLYRFPWLRSGLSAPATGSDYLLQTEYFPNKEVEMYVRIKHELDPEDVVAASQATPVVIHRHYTGIRYHISYRCYERLSLQNRLEAVRVEPETGRISWGFLIYQDAGYHFQKVPLDLDLRFAWFSTDDYSSRIYAYEQDLTSGFTFSPLYNKGFRSYVMIRYDLTGRIVFRFRLSHTNFIHAKTIGSGYDEIENNTRSEVKMQLIIRF
jgi:hypothetical protein